MKYKIIKFLKLRKNISDDQILKFIHFRKSKKLPFFFEEYLTDRFIKLKDIRYFNEFLWISNNKELIKKNKIIFQDNYRNKIFKYSYDKRLKYCLNLKKTKVKLDLRKLQNFSISFIGNPIFFIFPYLYFLRKKIKIEMINIKYHKNKLIFFIFYNFFFDLIYKIIFRNNYTIIKIKNKNELKKIKLKKKYDIGFHKLNFIIPKNIYGSYKKGLLNDHWAPLPLFKGRSALEYTKLFGSKLIVTNHLVTDKIDSGKIVLYSSINKLFPYLDIYLSISERIIDSIFQLSQSKFIKERHKDGIVFYKIHKWIKKQIN